MRLLKKEVEDEKVDRNIRGCSVLGLYFNPCGLSS
jgi:hypothetical protein